MSCIRTARPIPEALFLQAAEGGPIALVADGEFVRHSIEYNAAKGQLKAPPSLHRRYRYD